MLSRHNHIVTLDHRNNKLILFDNTTQLHQDFPLGLNSICPSDVKELCLSYDAKLCRILTLSGMLYSYNHKAQCFEIIELPEPMVKISEYFGICSAISDSGNLYLPGQNSKISIENEIIISHNGVFNLLLTNTGLYNFAIKKSRLVIKSRIVSKINICQIVQCSTHITYSYVLDVDDRLYVVIDNQLCHVQLPVKIKFITVRKCHIDPNRECHELIIVDYGNNIFECQYCPADNIIDLFSKYHHIISELVEIVDLLLIKKHHYVVTSDGQVYNLQSQTFLPYFIDCPIDFDVQPRVKSARSVKI